MAPPPAGALSIQLPFKHANMFSGRSPSLLLALSNRHTTQYPTHTTNAARLLSVLEQPVSSTPPYVQQSPVPDQSTAFSNFLCGWVGELSFGGVWAGPCRRDAVASPLAKLLLDFLGGNAKTLLLTHVQADFPADRSGVRKALNCAVAGRAAHAYAWPDSLTSPLSCLTSGATRMPQTGSTKLKLIAVSSIHQ